MQQANEEYEMAIMRASECSLVLFTNTFVLFCHRIEDIHAQITDVLHEMLRSSEQERESNAAG